MLKLLLHIIILIFLISCNDEINESGTVAVANPAGTYVLNPNMPEPGVIDFSGFSDFNFELISTEDDRSNERILTLSASGAINEKFIYFYSDPICITGFLDEVEVPGFNFEFNLFVGDKYPDGEFSIYYRLEDKSGIFSGCFEANINYFLDTTPPSMPSAQLFSPNSPISKIRTPEIFLGDLEQGATYSLFQSEECLASSYEFVAETSTHQFMIDLIGLDGEYNFYITRMDDLGNISECKPIGLGYELDTTAPKIPVFEVIGEDSEPDTSVDIDYPTPKIKITEIDANSLLQIFISSFKDNNHCETPFHEVFLEGEDETFIKIEELMLELEDGSGGYEVYTQVSDPYGNSSGCELMLQIGYEIKIPNLILVDANGEDININPSEEPENSVDPEDQEQASMFVHKLDNTLANIRVDEFLPGNKLVLYANKGSEVICSESSYDETLESNEKDKIDFHLSQGEGEYVLSYKIIDIYENSTECLGVSDFKYLFEFSKPSFYRISPISEGVNILNPTIEFREIYIDGIIRTYLSYNGEADTCSNHFLEKSTDEINESLTLSLDLNSGDGEYRVFTQLEDNFGNKSSCFEYEKKYILDTVIPDKPLPGSHITISDDDSGDSQFLFSYLGSASGENLYLYSDSSCSDEIGSESYSDGEYLVGVTNAQTQTVEIYGKFIDNASNESECSDKLGEYEFQLKVFGVLTYDFVPVSSSGLLFDQVEERPIRNAYVELFDMDAQSPTYNQVITSTNTNDLGEYELPLSAPQTVKVVVYAKMIEPSTIVWDNLNAYAQYVSASDTFEITTAQKIDLHASSGWEGTQANGSYTGPRSAAPYAILDSIYSAYKKIHDLRDNLEFPTLYVNWSPESTEGAYYMPWIGYLYLQGKYGVDTDEFDRHLIIHEWGHYFENSLSRSNSMGGSHGMGDTKDMSLAFGEGFATGLSAMVFEPDATYTDTTWWTGIEWGFTMDVERGYYRPDSNPGWFSEVSVQQMVYDLVDEGVDSIVETHDNIALGMGPILDVLTGHQVNTPARTSIFSFINGLKNLVPEWSAEIDEIVEAKGIETIVDDWGTGNNAYINMYPNTTRTVSLSGGYLHNDLASNKHLKYQADSSSTTFTFNGSNYYIADIIYKNSSKYGHSGYFNNPGIDYSVTFDTIPGEYYSIRVYTSKDAVSSGSVSVSISAESL